MRILKWLFHPINLLIIVIVVALYINRHTLFPEFSESPEVKQLTNRVDSVIDSLNETVSSLAAEKDSDDLSKPETDTQTDIATASADVPVAPATDTRAVIDELPQATTVSPQEIPPQQSERTIASVPQEKPMDSAAGEAEPTSPVASTVPADASADHAAADPLALWEEARRAAWEGNNDKAIAQYRSLIALQPGNFDAFGEMGNVLLRKGDREAAVDAYYQAAMLLSKAGYPQGAWRVLDIVAHLDQKKAQELYQAIRSQQLGVAQPQQK